MTKRLPKATQSTMNDIRESADAAAEAADTAAESAAEPAAESTALRTAETAAQPAPEAPLPVPAPRPIDAGLHRAQAAIIVERHATYSALGGCIPVTIFDTISVGLVIFNMVQQLAGHYRVPFQRDRIKAGIAALAGGIAAPGLGSLATGLFAAIVPGTWLIGAAASSAAAAAFTRYSGEAFIAHFESGGTTLDFDMERLKGYFRKPLAA